MPGAEEAAEAVAAEAEAAAAVVAVVVEEAAAEVVHDDLPGEIEFEMMYQLCGSGFGISRTLTSIAHDNDPCPCM